MSKLFALLTLCVVFVVVPSFSDADDVYKSKSSDDYVPCEEGWYYFRNKCYRVAGRRNPERLYWKDALALCKEYGADLVSIQSKEEQNFIVAYLQLDVNWWAWTGLNDLETEGDYMWSDRSAFNYSNWKRYEPSGRDSRGGEEDCVHMLYEPSPASDVIGQWNDRACDVPEYVFCEKNANQRAQSPNLMYCSPQDRGGWKYENSCFHIVNEMRTWECAEQYCKERFGGHLLTIRDTLQDFFLENALPGIEKETWIGIKVQGQVQQKWTSGWYVSYDRFNQDVRNAAGSCVARKNRKEWITVPCSRKLPFICEVSKVGPPTLKPAPADAHCPKDLDDWRDLGGEYCYYIETGKSLNFYEANFDCHRRGGQMVSLHSQEEANILQPFIRHKKNEFFIGLIRHKANNEDGFGWTDGSPVDYENWSYNEPNRKDEKCVQAVSRTLKWHDIPCEWTHLGYVCAVKKIVPNSSGREESADCEKICLSPENCFFGVISKCNEAKRIS